MRILTSKQEGVIEMEIDVAIQSLGLLLKKDDGYLPSHAIATFQISLLHGVFRSYSRSSFAVSISYNINIILLTNCRPN